MHVRVDGMVWLQKSEAEPRLLRYLREQLIVVPRKFSEFDKVDPAPICCFAENAGEFGVPRRWWFEHSRESHQYRWDVSFGSPIELDSRLEFDGVYREQEGVVNTFEEYFNSSRFAIERGPSNDANESARIGYQLGGILKATTGFGKTNVALEIIRRLGVTTIVLVHKEMLLKQWIERIHRWLPNAKVGIVQEKKCDFEGKDIVIAMEQSLARDDGSRYPKELWSAPGLVVADECFVGSQRIQMADGSTKAISEINVNDLVVNANGWGCVEKVYKREVPLSHMVVVEWCDGKAVCTDSHPFLTQRGWVKAIELQESDSLLTPSCCIDTMMGYGHKAEAEYMCLVREGKVRSEGASILLPAMCREGKTGNDALVRGVPRNSGQAVSESFLFDILSAEMDAFFVYRPHLAGEKVKGCQGTACEKSEFGARVVQTHEGKQSDAVERGAFESVSSAQKQGAQASKAWWQWGGVDETAESSFGCIESGVLVGRVCGGDGGKARKGGIAKSLQNRPSKSRQEGCNRGGWQFTQCPGETKSGQEKRSLFDVKRVVGVSRAKQSDIGQCKDGCGIRQTSYGNAVEVFNISVSGHPSYVLADLGQDGVVVHNCHRVSAPTWAPLLPRFSSAFRLGLSATPRRKDNTDDVFWWNIGPVVYSAKTEMPKPGVRLMSVPSRVEDMGALSNPDLPSGLVLTLLGRSFQRNRFIMQQVIYALRSPHRRKIMVLSDRLEHLRALDRLFHEAQEHYEELQGVTTGFYVGQWYTGETVEKLSPGTWPMKDGGRDEAIKIVYNSLSRRKRKDCETMRDCFIAEVPAALITRPWTEFSAVATKAMQTHELRKAHVVVYEDASLPFLSRFSWYDPDERKPVALALEALTNEEIFQVAEYYRIQQKTQEKMKKLTDEQLSQAARARVLFATFSLVSEGIDIPALDTLVLATPISDVEQAAGRIRRFCVPNPNDPDKCEFFCPWKAEDCAGKADPVICDVVDSLVPLGARRVEYRKEFYLTNGFAVWEKGRS